MDGEDNTEFLIEYQVLGNSVKVSAVDPVTLTEVSIVGPATAGEEELARNAVNKLKFVLAKARGWITGVAALKCPIPCVSQSRIVCRFGLR